MTGFASSDSRLESNREPVGQFGSSNRPKSVKEQMCLLKAEWIAEKIKLCIIQTLRKSMLRRIEAVIASGGGSTNYKMQIKCGYHFISELPKYLLIDSVVHLK